MIYYVCVHVYQRQGVSLSTGGDSQHHMLLFSGGLDRVVQAGRAGRSRCSGTESVLPTCTRNMGQKGMGQVCGQVSGSTST